MKRILLMALVASTIMTVSAQKKPSEPDLRLVPGYVVNHDTPIVNPVPVMMNVDKSAQTINISNGIRLKDIPADIAWTAKRLKTSDNGYPVRFEVAGNKRGRSEHSGVEGWYRLALTPNGGVIEAADDTGAFYGLQTLLQYLENSNETSVSPVEIEDYPSLQFRGVVEGFYGNPWSHKTRLSLIDFMGRHKMNTYVYGPKDDPYHRTPYWRQPYPETEGQRIKELVERSKLNKVNFAWAIHPGGDIRWDAADTDSLMNKFQSMYDLGVRQFAIFFDDIKGKGTDSHQQTNLLNKVAQEFVATHPDMKNLIVCPTDYARNRADASPKGQLTVYGQELDPSVQVFWTGKVVCGDIEPESLEFVDSRIKRPALVWWNFPVTDYCKNNLLLGPVYGLDTTLTSNQLSGIVSNPMEYGEASKSALYGVADYSWNTPVYNALDNWTRSFEEVMPGAADSYGVFAMHSADPPRNYRRNESWNVETFFPSAYTAAQYSALKNEFEKICKVEGDIIKNGKNVDLVKELAPWLVEFTNLGNRGLLALELIKIKESGDNDKFLNAYNYLNELNKVQKRAYSDYISGTLKLQPFVDNVLAELAPAK